MAAMPQALPLRLGRATEPASALGSGLFGGVITAGQVY